MIMVNISQKGPKNFISEPEFLILKVILHAKKHTLKDKSL